MLIKFVSIVLIKKEDINIPEGSECRVITDELAQAIQGKYLRQTYSCGGRYKNIAPEGSDLPLPLKITEVNCKGKFIYWQLGHEWSLWNTLGMTGSWNPQSSKHTSLKFWISNDESSKDGFDIYFNDIRHFGTVKFVKGSHFLEKKLFSLGPDMLNHPTNLADFTNIIRVQNNRNITVALMDQSVVSGIGNYIKCESLYKAGISPWRECGSLSNAELKLLYFAIREIMQKSYSEGGATIATYKTFSGKVGNYSKFFEVYGKSEDLLGNAVVKDTTPDKRTTHWVPEKQT